MPISDADLLARWRALRPGAENSGSATPDQPSATGMNHPTISLEERFRNLRPVNSEPICVRGDWLISGQDKPSDDGSNEISQTATPLGEAGDVDEPDFSEVDGLLQEARSLISQYSALRSDNEALSQGPEEAQAASTQQRSESDDSEMASEHIQQALDEVEAAGLGEDGAEQGRGDHEEDLVADKSDEEEKHSEADSSVLDLPSVPSGPPTQAASNKITDDDLLARLNALKVNDAGAAETSAGSLASQEGKGDDDETWCIICCDDATMKCLGCDGDLYCGNCWKEGHRGEDAGMEERRHKAVLYQKPRKKKKRMVAA
jgi:hypothetical protein